MNHSTDTLTLAKHIIDGMHTPTTEKIVATLFALEIVNTEVAEGFTIDFWVNMVDRFILVDGFTYLGGLRIKGENGSFTVNLEA